MGLLQWIKGTAARQLSASHETPNPTSENAKQMYTRLDVQERAGLTAIDQMPPEQLAKVDAIKATLEKATRHLHGSAQHPAAVLSDANDGRLAVRQSMAAQESPAAALSPTSGQAGIAPSEHAGVAPQEKGQGRPQTLPRPTPSWER